MLNLSKDGLSILVPGENLGLIIMMLQECLDGGNEIWNTFKHTASNAALRQLSIPPLDHIQPRVTGGREMEMHPGVSLEPALHRRTFMRAVIVHDKMQLEFSGRGLINGFQKSDKFLTPVSR